MSVCVAWAYFESLKITIEWMMIKHPITHSLANAMYAYTNIPMPIRLKNTLCIKSHIHANVSKKETEKNKRTNETWTKII